MSLASVSAQQNSALRPCSAVSPRAARAAAHRAVALNSLSSNFGDFLNLLMTQLQNQDPTSPMDTNQFTTELVEFSSVEQQINTNTSLTQLIQLTQGGEMMQASSMTGKQVTVSSDHVPLQNGKGDDPVHRAVERARGYRHLQATPAAKLRRDHWCRANKGHQHVDLGRQGQLRPFAAGWQLQGGGGGRQHRWDGECADVQRGGHRHRRAEPVQRHTAANGSVIGRLLKVQSVAN